MLTALQQTGIPFPVPAEGPTGEKPLVPSGPGRDNPVPPIGLDPSPGTDIDLSKPINPPPGQTREEYRAGEALTSEVASALVPQAISFDDAEAAGLPRNSKPYVIDIQQAFTLALINARIYQFNLENLYIQALNVTLQRFAFTPQFYAASGQPTTGVLGGRILPPTLGNAFTYQTAETGQQLSALSLGTVAGFGKAFSSGATLLAGFANQLVFNFIGKNSFQPTVKSYLPLNLIQPLLRGGGRAVTLEPLTLAERQLLYQVRAFAKFRQEFTVATLIGGQVQNFGSAVPSLGFTGASSTDPQTGFINVLEDIQVLENNVRNISAYEQILRVYIELAKGEASGISQLQVDQVAQGLQNARGAMLIARNQYRNDLDSIKMQIGMPPDVPMMLERSITRPFKLVFDAIDEWQRDGNRRIEDLPKFLDGLPKLQDVVIDGRSVLGVYSNSQNNEDKLEDLLLAAERTAMEHRLDLMNARAQLYDTWRAIKVTANALMGVLNVGLTNTFVTPPNTTNPFGFVEQAKTFSLVINGELPLVRVNERNQFRTALIAYERQRRALMSTEDSIKLIVRGDVRSMQLQYLEYEIAKRNFILAIRQKDQAFEQIVAPPAGVGTSQAPLQTTNLINFQSSLIGSENSLVTNWYQFQLARLQLYRDLGTLPFDEWEAFYELFPELNNPAGASSYAGTARTPAARVGGGASREARAAAR
jgi:hypothetical protein